MVIIVALVDAEPDVGVWEEGAEDLGDADVATLLENTLEDGVLGAALSEDGVGVGTVGACSATQPVLGRRLRVGREGGPLGGGDSRVILVGESAPVVPEGFVLEATGLQSETNAEPTVVFLGALWAEHVQAGKDIGVDASIAKSLIVGDSSEPVGVAFSGIAFFLLVLFALAHLFEGFHEGVGDGRKVNLPGRDLPLLIGRWGDDEEAGGLDSVALGARDGADIHREVVSGIVLELPRTVGEGDSVALGGTPEDVMRPLACGLSCRREEAGVLGLPNRNETGIVDVDADEVAHKDADGLARSQDSLPVGVIMVPGVCATFVGPSRGLEAVAIWCAMDADRHKHILWCVLLEPESKPIHGSKVLIVRGNVQSLKVAAQ